jgi:hypothetical protein
MCGSGCLAGSTGATLDQEDAARNPDAFQADGMGNARPYIIANEQLHTSWPTMETFEVCLEAQASGVKLSQLLEGDLAGGKRRHRSNGNV